MTPYLTVYCFVSALMQFALGIGWDGFNPPHRAIKYAFLFSSVWGFFLGAMLLRGML
jgi:hypothetical protein